MDGRFGKRWFVAQDDMRLVVAVQKM